MAHRHQERVDSTKKIFFKKKALFVPFYSETEKNQNLLWNVSQIGPVLGHQGGNLGILGTVELMLAAILNLGGDQV